MPKPASTSAPAVACPSPTAPPLRISIVQGAFLPVPPLQGGAIEKAFHALGCGFAARGHTVTHVSRCFPGLADDEWQNGVRYRRVPGYDAPLRLWRLKWLDLLYSRRACRLLPPADVLVTHTFWLPLLERRPSRGLPYVHVGRYPRGQLRFYPPRAILQTGSAAIQNAILAEVPARAQRIRVIPYPLTSDYLVDPAVSPSRTVLYVGRIHPEKGLELLIEAFRQFHAGPGSGWKLRLVGPHETRQGGGGSAFRDRLVKAAAGLPVEIPGPEFAVERLIAHYREAAVFVYPSLAERGETFGLAVLEAMAAGAPSVVSGLPCFQEYIEPGKNGLVFDERSPVAAAQLAHALGALAAEPRRRDALAEAAWHTARRYTLDRVVERYLADFAALCPADPSRVHG